MSKGLAISMMLTAVVCTLVLVAAGFFAFNFQTRKMDEFSQKVADAAAVLERNQRPAAPPDVQMRDIKSAADESKTAAESKKAVMAIMANLLSRIEAIESSTKPNQEALISLQRRMQDFQWALETGSGELKRVPDENLPLTVMSDKPSASTTVEAISRTQQPNTTIEVGKTHAKANQ